MSKFIRRYLGILCGLVVLTASPALGQRQAVEQSREYVQQALAAYQAGDVTTYRDKLRQALELRPNHPGLMYRLAGAYALAGQPRDALAWLEHYAALGLAATPGTDDDFAAVHDAEEFAAIVAHLEHNAEPAGTADVAFRLDDPAFIPESVVFDPATGSFFVGSVHQRRLVRVDSSGRVTPFATREDGLWSVLGLAVDADRRWLWATSAALPQTEDVADDEQGRTAVFQFDLDTGALLHAYPGTAGTERVLSDLTVAPGGTVFVTDGHAGVLYRIDPETEAIDVVLDPGTLISPQGVCFFGPERRLVIADYALGLVTVDLQARAVSVIPPPADETLLGIDGLACYDDRVIAIQNGVRPYRVVQFALNPETTHVERTEVLVANHPAFEEPTLGTVVGDVFYFVANSQWNRFDQDGRLPPEEDLAAPVILKTALRPEGE